MSYLRFDFRDIVDLKYMHQAHELHKQESESASMTCALQKKRFKDNMEQ